MYKRKVLHHSHTAGILHPRDMRHLDRRLWAVDGDARASGAEVALGSHDLVVVRTKIHALGSP